MEEISCPCSMKNIEPVQEKYVEKRSIIIGYLYYCHYLKLRIKTSVRVISHVRLF